MVTILPGMNFLALAAVWIAGSEFPREGCWQFGQAAHLVWGVDLVLVTGAWETRKKQFTWTRLWFRFGHGQVPVEEEWMRKSQSPHFALVSCEKDEQDAVSGKKKAEKQNKREHHKKSKPDQTGQQDPGIQL